MLVLINLYAKSLLHQIIDFGEYSRLCSLANKGFEYSFDEYERRRLGAYDSPNRDAFFQGTESSAGAKGVAGTPANIRIFGSSLYAFVCLRVHFVVLSLVRCTRRPRVGRWAAITNAASRLSRKRNRFAFATSLGSCRLSHH